MFQRKEGVNDPMTRDEYFQSLPKSSEGLFQNLRTFVLGLITNGQEVMKYGIPTIVVSKKNIVHYAAYSGHVALYPGSQAIAAFQKELSAYKCSKGTIQFPLNQELPFDLIQRIVQYNVTHLL